MAPGLSAASTPSKITKTASRKQKKYFCFRQATDGFSICRRSATEVHTARRQREAVLTCCLYGEATLSCERGLSLELVAVVKNIQPLRGVEQRLKYSNRGGSMLSVHRVALAVVACVAGRRRPDLGRKKIKETAISALKTQNFSCQQAQFRGALDTLGLPPQTPVRTHTPVSRYAPSTPRAFLPTLVQPTS